MATESVSKIPDAPTEDVIFTDITPEKPRRSRRAVAAVTGLVILGLAAAFFAATVVLRTGDESGVLDTPSELDAQADMLEAQVVQSRIELIPGRANTLLPEGALNLVPSNRELDQGSVYLRASVEGPFRNVGLYTYEEIVTDETGLETLERCFAAFQIGFGAKEGGGTCTADEIGAPQFVQFGDDNIGSLEVALFHTVEGSATMTIETVSGFVVESNIVNDTGYVQWDGDQGRARWMTLFNTDGAAIWSMRMS